MTTYLLTLKPSFFKVVTWLAGSATNMMLKSKTLIASDWAYFTLIENEVEIHIPS